MSRCPSKTYFGCSLSKLVKIGNILLSERDKFLPVPLCQSLMPSNKLNKIFSTSKSVPLFLSSAYFGCSYILGLCFRYL